MLQEGLLHSNKIDTCRFMQKRHYVKSTELHCSTANIKFECMQLTLNTSLKLG